MNNLKMRDYLVNGETATEIKLVAIEYSSTLFCAIAGKLQFSFQCKSCKHYQSLLELRFAHQTCLLYINMIKIRDQAGDAIDTGVGGVL